MSLIVKGDQGSTPEFTQKSQELGGAYLIYAQDDINNAPDGEAYYFSKDLLFTGGVYSLKSYSDDIASITLSGEPIGDTYSSTALSQFDNITIRPGHHRLDVTLTNATGPCYFSYAFYLTGSPTPEVISSPEGFIADLVPPHDPVSIFFDGFEQFDKAEEVAAQMRKADYQVAGVVEMAQGRVVGKCISTHRSSVTLAYPWQGDIFSFGFAAKFTARGGLCGFNGGRLVIDSVTGLPSFLGVTGSTIPRKASWYYYEFEFNRVTGKAQFFINGKGDGEGALPADLLNAALVSITLNAFTSPTSVADPSKSVFDRATRMYDDVYIRSGPRLGPLQIETRFPLVDLITEWERSDISFTHSQTLGNLPTDELDRHIQTPLEGADDRLLNTSPLHSDNPLIALGAVGLIRKTNAYPGSIDYLIGPKKANVANITLSWKYQYRAWLADDLDTVENTVNYPLELIAHIET